MYDDDDSNELLCCRYLPEVQVDASVRHNWKTGSGNQEEADDADFVFVGNGVGLGPTTTVAGKPSNSPPKSSCRRGPIRSDVEVSCVDERRRRGSEIRMRLQTIHPNPGPRQRTGRVDEAKKLRREKRKVRRKRNSDRKKERKRQERLGKVKEELRVVTWNVQGMSLRGRWKRKVKTVVNIAKEQEWDAVMLTEINADGDGVVWLGQDEELAAIVHSEKAAILLRGELLKRWCEGGQKKKLSGRVGSVKVDGVNEPIMGGNGPK